MKEVSKSKDGFINLDELKAAAGFEDDVTLDKSMVTFNGGMPLLPMPSDDAEKNEVHIPDPVLASITMAGTIATSAAVKGKKATKSNLVCNSQGSMSRDKTSVWEPVASGSLKQNKVSINLGHFAEK